MSLQPDDVSFEIVCNFMESLSQHRKNYVRRRKRIEVFIEHVVDRASGDAFSIFRLVLPNLDYERGSYHLKEAKLGKLFVTALGWGEDDPRARGILSYRDAGHDPNAAGKLSHIIEQAGYLGACELKNNAPDDKKKEMKVGDVNRKLDELAAARDAQSKAKVLRYFLTHATPRNLKWLVQIILRNPRHGTGETAILNAWHRDAKDFFDARGQDLRAVFNTMIDPDRPYTSALQLGMNARPQLASRVYSAADALKSITATGEKEDQSGAAKQADGPFLIETKFDGERIQVHRDGDSINYFSRRSIDHGERSNYSEMDAVIKLATGDHSKVIIDGEMVAWNRKKQVMVPFGVLKKVFNAVRDEADPTTVIVSENGLFYGADDADGASDAQAPAETNQGRGNGAASGGSSSIEHRLEDLDIVYIAFDLLYDAAEGGTIVDRRLSDRRDRLAAAIPSEVSIPVPNRSGVAIRVVPLIPDQTTLFSGGPLLSWTASTLEDIDAAVKSAQARREEGVMLKRLDSPWSVNDRHSHAWLKIKPDYVSNFDIQAVIVGVYLGAGKRGGEIGQYLLALRCAPPPGETPLPGGSWFKTFVRVGSGLSDDERTKLHNVLVDKVGLREGGRGSIPPPGVTACTPPEKWVVDPLKSEMLSVHADIRMIASAEYATGLSLRFPTITAWRRDLSPLDSEDADGLQERTRTQMRVEAAAGMAGRKKRKGQGGRGRKKVGAVTGLLRNEEAAVKATEVENSALAGKRIFVLETGDDRKVAVRCAVKAAGGVAPANFKGPMDYVVAFGPLEASRLNIFQTGVVTPEWVAACRAAGTLRPLRPRHLWHLGPREQGSSAEVDIYGAPYFAKLTVGDLEALVSRHMAAAPVAKKGALDPLSLLQQLRAMPAQRRGGKPTPRPAVTGAAAREALEAAQAEAARLRARGVKPGPHLLLPWLDAELEARGALDRGGAVLHGCTLLLLELPGPNKGPAAVPPEQPSFLLAATLAAESAGKRAAEAARRLRFSRLRIQARQLGAAVVEEMRPHVTHVVGVTSAFLNGISSPKDESGEPEGSPSAPFSAPRPVAAATAAAAGQAPSPAALLRAIADRGGGSRCVYTLRDALVAREVTLVTAEWVQKTAAVAAMAAAAVRYLEGRSDNADDGERKMEISASDGAGPSSGPPPLPLPLAAPVSELEPHADVAIARPDPADYSLMDAADMGDLKMWPWAEHGAAEVPRRVPVALGGAVRAAAQTEEAMAVDMEALAAAALPSRRSGYALQKTAKRHRPSPTSSPAAAAPQPSPAARGRPQGRGRAAASLSEDVIMEEGDEEKEGTPPTLLPQRRRGWALTLGRRGASVQPSQPASLALQQFSGIGSAPHGGGPWAPVATVPRRGDAPAPGAALQSQAAAAAGPSQRRKYTYVGIFDDPEPEAAVAGAAGGTAGGGAGPSAAAGTATAAMPSHPGAAPAGGGAVGVAPPRMGLKQALEKFKREIQGQK